MAECSELERKLIDAVLEGDPNRIDAVKAELAYEALPESLRAEYRAALLESERVTARLNAVIEQIPDRCRGKVIERLKKEARDAAR